MIPGTKRATIQRQDWNFWCVDAGRGFGKTRVGAETVREWARNPLERILLIAPTASDVREVMLEGPSGLLNLYPPALRPDYNPSRHRIVFPSGAIGFTRSADEPERLRGPQFTKFWADELCAWRFVSEAWQQIMFGFRLKGTKLQGVITTTPKPIDVLKAILKDPTTVVTHGSSYENRDNLSEQFFDKVIKPYEGTRIGRQEIDGELLEDTPGALWVRAMIDGTRIDPASIRWDLIQRVVIAVDPAVTASEDSDETGIAVVALAKSGHCVVLADLSGTYTVAEWANKALEAFFKYRADRIVGEVNNGGDLVERNLRVSRITIEDKEYSGSNVPYRAVRASRGKMTRAEPVSAMYERRLVHHAGVFRDLEDEMCTWVPGMSSPSRMDAMVWGVTELAVDPEPAYLQVQYPTVQISPV